MSASVPEVKVACRKRWRNCDSSKRKLQIDYDDGEGTGKKMRTGDGKNMNTGTVFLEKKEKKRLNKNSSEKKTREDDYKEEEKKNGKASATFIQEKVKEKLKVSCSKKNVHTKDDVKEKDVRNEVTATSSEKERKKKRPTNTDGGMKWLPSDVGEEKRTRNLDCKMRNGESSATFFEKGKEKKRLNSTNMEKKAQRDDNKYGKNIENRQYNKTTSRKVSTAPYEKEKKKKMWSRDNAEKKINGVDRSTSPLFSKNKIQSSDGKKRTDPITSVNEKKMRPYESTEMKMQRGVKQKKRNVPSDTSKEKKTKAPIDCNYEKRKREESNTLFKKVKRMHYADNYKKIHSGKVEEKNCGDGEEVKRNTPFSFFKVICNNFKEYLSVPPRVALELEGFTNHHVYLQDSEGKLSKIRLSVVDGSLAFHQGWNIFVSDHLIKWGDFLLFEHTAKSTFSVRIFGRDSCERLHFDVGWNREGVKKKEMHTDRAHDDLISIDVKSEDDEDDYYFSGEYPRNKEPETLHVTVHKAEDPKRVKQMVGSGPVPLDSRNGNEVIRQCRTQGMCPLRSKEKRVILITDSGSSMHENDIAKLITSTADSDTHHVGADTNEYPKRVQNGIWNGQSAVVGVEKEILTDVECGNKCTSPMFGVKKAANSVQSGMENGPSAVVEDEKGILPDVECGTKCTSQKCNEEAVPVDAAPLAHENDDNNDGEMNVSPDICRNYEAPGGFRCLEKWKNRIVRHGVVLDGTGLSKPESTQETDSKFVVEHGAVGLNPGDKCFLSKDTSACSQQIFTMPIKDPVRPDRVSMCEHDGTQSYHRIDEKGTVVQLHTKKEQMQPVGSTENLPKDNYSVCANLVTPRNYGAVGLSPVRSEGICALVELQPTGIKNPSSPDRISNCEDSMTEFSDDIDGNGTIAKLETKMGHLEPVGSIVSTQTTNPRVCANNAAACRSEHCFSKQEDTNSVEFSSPAKPEILESDDRSVLKVNLQFCIPDTTQKWLELPKSLSNAVRQRRLDRNIIMLKDPMKRLWPVFYHENSIFVGFTSGWKHFSAANDLQIGDLCELSTEPGDEEPVYSVQVTKK